jgi:hypothetical protein
MSSLRPQDRASLCRFTFADGRRCRTPLIIPTSAPTTPAKTPRPAPPIKSPMNLAYFFSGEYLSACDLNAALGSLIAAVAGGDIKPRAARTVACLSQTLAQTIHLAQHEYINTLGTDSWRKAVSNSIHQNFDHRNDSPQLEVPPTPPPTPPPPPLQPLYNQHL